MAKLIIILALLCVTTFGEDFDTQNSGIHSGFQPDALEWIDIDRITQLTTLISVQSGSIKSYVARGRLLGTKGTQWVPGRAFKTGSKSAFVAHLSFRYLEHQQESDFQVLVTKPEATRWIEVYAIPEHAVVGGRDPDTLELTLVCQAIHNGTLVIGKMLSNYRNCHVASNGTEYVSSSSVKVLVANND
ncbi:unnamed protein product [Orchesella dallaii]|uniref:Uncharacterized protein n=1 Tax=Orchesella dallaii TaxID=48710 RepID=A0ABP1PI59_9HEXA